MDVQYTPVAVCMFAAAALSAFNALFIWRRRRQVGAHALVLLMLAIFIWTVFRTLEALFVAQGLKVAMAKFEYVGIAAVPVLWFFFAFQYTGAEKTSFRQKAWLWIVPAITFLLVMTNERHGLIWRAIYPNPGPLQAILVYEHGLWFWIQMVFAYALLLLGTLRLAWAAFSRLRLSRQQSGAILAAAVIPWVGNAVYLSGHSPVRGLDLTPLAFTVTGVLLSWGLFRYRLLDLRPIARDKLIEGLPDGVIVFDALNRIVDINPAACRLLACRVDDMIGKALDDLLRNMPELNFLRSEAGAAKQEILLQHLTPPCCLEVSLSPLKDIHHRLSGKLVLLRDKTEDKRFKDQMKRAEQMEAIGALAGGVAHDLNNILSAIVGYPDLILMQISEDSPLRKPVQTIKESGNKAAAIVQDLLTLSRRGVAVKEPLNLNSIVQDFFASPECEKIRSFHPEVSFDLDLSPDLLDLAGSPVHLNKTIMNLVSNAAEAMNDPGIVSLRTFNYYIDNPAGAREDRKEGDYVVLQVADTGVGISKADQERIFEPFFTKKVMGRSGTGLGMAVVWGTVKDHEGYIDVESSTGKGSIFTLYFPASRERAAPRSGTFHLSDYAGSGELILVVDDMEDQRQIANNMLTALGYCVATVSDGAAAASFVKERPPDLILLDMIMETDMDGLDAFKQIVSLRPEQKVIIVSGFSETTRVKEALRLGVRQYIRKPYTIEKIAVAVKKELG